jgi:UDP-glucose 4-epimerase
MEAILRQYAKISGEQAESRISGVIHFATHKTVEESI